MYKRQPLHIGLDGDAQGRRALAPKPHLGGGDAADARARTAPLSDRRPALSHECVGAGQARKRRPRHHRAAAAVHRARLYRRDRALPLHLAHRGAADDRDDAARAGRTHAGRFRQRRVHPHGLGASQRKPDGGDPSHPAESIGDQRLRHHGGRSRRIRSASEGTAAARDVGRLSASQGFAALGRWRQARRRPGRAGDEEPGPHERLSQPSGREAAVHRGRLLHHRRRLSARRRRLPLFRRPHRRHVRVGRREHLSRRRGAHAGAPSRRRPGRGGPDRRRDQGPEAGGLHRAEGGPHADRRRDQALRARERARLCASPLRLVRRRTAARLDQQGRPRALASDGRRADRLAA